MARRRMGGSRWSLVMALGAFALAAHAQDSVDADVESAAEPAASASQPEEPASETGVLRLAANSVGTNAIARMPAATLPCTCTITSPVSPLVRCVIGTQTLLTTRDAVPAACPPPPPPPPQCTADGPIVSETVEWSLPPTGPLPAGGAALTSWVDPLFSGLFSRIPLFAGAEVKSETKGKIKATTERQTRCCSGQPSSKATLKGDVSVSTKVTASARLGFHTLLSIFPQTAAIEQSPLAPGSKVDNFMSWAGVSLQQVTELGNEVGSQAVYRLQQASCDTNCKYLMLGFIGGFESSTLSDTLKGSLALQATSSTWFEVKAGGRIDVSGQASIGFKCSSGGTGYLQAKASGCLYAKIKAIGYEYKACSSDWFGDKAKWAFL